MLAGCAAVPAEPGGQSRPTETDRPAATSPVPPAREGRPAKSERVQFEPRLLVLPGNARAEVKPAATVKGMLKVPEDVRHVGWWDGSAYAGEPFGSTVIAGHVDSASGGIGFFARLLGIKIGDVVTLRDDEHRQRYKITSIQTVARQALATDSQAFDQTGDHRLVLITCTGTFRRDRGGYDSNLVVIGKPLGLAR